MQAGRGHAQPRQRQRQDGRVRSTRTRSTRTRSTRARSTRARLRQRQRASGGRVRSTAVQRPAAARGAQRTRGTGPAWASGRRSEGTPARRACACRQERTGDQCRENDRAAPGRSCAPAGTAAGGDGWPRRCRAQAWARRTARRATRTLTFPAGGFSFRSKVCGLPCRRPGVPSATTRAVCATPCTPRPRA